MTHHTPLPADLPSNYAAAFRRIEQAAAAGEQIKQADIEEAMGSRNSSGSSSRVACRWLEERGFIRAKSYQRGMQVMIVATGASTKPPANTAPCWRDRKRAVSIPAVSVTYVKQRTPDLARDMMVAARREGLTVQEFMAKCLYDGWVEYQAAIQTVSEKG